MVSAGVFTSCADVKILPKHQCNVDFCAGCSSENICGTCNVGYFLDGSQCKPCNDGQTSLGQTCSDCPSGTYQVTQANPPSRVCKSCSDGQISPKGASGQNACTSCLSPKVPSEDKSQCTCPPGFTTNGDGCDAPTECPPGYKLRPGNSCDKCLAGTFSKGGTAETCTKCTGELELN